MTHQFSDTVFQIFTKAPIAGHVKTRLLTHISAYEAASVYKELIERTLHLVCQEQFCKVQLWCSPDQKHSYFKDIEKRYSVSLHTQSQGDLGQRMSSAIKKGLKEYKRIILMGCDCPSINQEDIQLALKSISGDFDCVMAPTEDGGYALIGMKKVHHALFTNMRWSCVDVAEITRKRMQKLQLKCYELGLQWDVDTYSDYKRFMLLDDRNKQLNKERCHFIL